MHTYGQGRYRVVRPLGSGAFAVVHEVEDTRLGVRRALKVLRPEVASDPVARARFAAEARTMASLRHPHLVAVLDVGEDAVASSGEEGLTQRHRDTENKEDELSETSSDVSVTQAAVWLVMELVPGGTLAEAVQREGASDPVAAVRAMLGVIEGVGLAHRSGVVHRDIKPANLLVDADGGLKLGDFGVAQLRTMDDLTRTGVALGSWAFMAPEQRLDPRRVGPTSDVYGLAATLVWRIHGAPVSDLHVGEHRARLLARAPEGLAAVLSRALAFRAEERYRTAEAFGEALREAIAEAEGEGTVVGLVPASVRQDVELGAGGLRPPATPPGSARRAASTRDAAAPRGDTVAGAAQVPARGGALRAWGLAGLALVVGVGAGGWAMTREEVRGRFVTEPEEVRRARELAAIPVCEDAPTRWSHRYFPRWESSVPGGREAGGGIATDIDRDGDADLMFVHALEAEFRVYWGTGADLEDTPTRVPAYRMTQGIARSGDVGDIDGDGIVDLVGVALEDSGLIVSRGLGGRKFEAATRIDSGEIPYEVRIVDWDRDGNADIVYTTSATPTKRLRWRRSRGGGGFDAVSDLYDGVHSFDVIPEGLDLDVHLAFLTSGDLWVAQRTVDGRLRKAHPVLVNIPLQPVDQVRVQPSGDALLWSAGATTGVALRVSVASGNVCKINIPQQGWVQDIQDIDGDSILDAVSLQSCAYCTSSYGLLVGNR